MPVRKYNLVPVKLAYFGTADFAVPALRALAPHLALVVSQPDRPSGRGMKLHASPVKLAAVELGLPVETPEKARAAEFVEHIRSLELDALVVAAYGQILSVALLESAKRGGINLHGSILPKYRGAAPIQRSILNGNDETGVTLMQMAKGMDTGDIIAISRTPIGPDETYGELQARLADIAADLAAEWMPRIVTGDYPRVVQDEQEATIAPKITKDEAEVRFDMTAREAYQRYRAFTPAPGAFLRTSLGLIRVGKASLGSQGGAPGTLIASDTVAFASGSLQLIEIKPEGKPKMSMRDFANGMRLKVGDSLLS